MKSYKSGCSARLIRGSLAVRVVRLFVSVICVSLDRAGFPVPALLFIIAQILKDIHIDEHQKSLANRMLWPRSAPLANKNAAIRLETTPLKAAQSAGHISANMISRLAAEVTGIQPQQTATQKAKSRSPRKRYDLFALISS